MLQYAAKNSHRFCAHYNAIMSTSLNDDTGMSVVWWKSQLYNKSDDSRKYFDSLWLVSSPHSLAQILDIVVAFKSATNELQTFSIRLFCSNFMLETALGRLRFNARFSWYFFFFKRKVYLKWKRKSKSKASRNLFVDLK